MASRTGSHGRIMRSGSRISLLEALMDKERQIALFDKQANQYDRQRESAFQKRWRAPLLRHAKGKVLEVAVGAGANFPFYPPGVSVTATDFSPAMIAKAEAAARRYGVAAEFLCTDVEALHVPEQSFDTIVSTLSLCGYEDPAAVLANLKRWVKPQGKLLFMEHGISPKPLVSGLQRLLDPVLYRMLGCHHTRDIRALIEGAGLRIVDAETHWLGMVRLIRAQP